MLKSSEQNSRDKRGPYKKTRERLTINCPKCGQSDIVKDGICQKGKNAGKQLWECLGCRRNFIQSIKRDESTKEDTVNQFPYLLNRTERMGALKRGEKVLTILGLAKHAEIQRQTVARWYRKWKTDPKCQNHTDYVRWRRLYLFYAIVIEECLGWPYLLTLVGNIDKFIDKLVATSYLVTDWDINRHGQGEDWEPDGTRKKALHEHDPEVKPDTLNEDSPIMDWPSASELMVKEIIKNQIEVSWETDRIIKIFFSKKYPQRWTLCTLRLNHFFPRVYFQLRLENKLFSEVTLIKPLYHMTDLYKFLRGQLRTKERFYWEKRGFSRKAKE